MMSVFDNIEEHADADPRFSHIPRPVISAKRNNNRYTRPNILPLSNTSEVSFYFLNVQGLGTSIEKCSAISQTEHFLAFQNIYRSIIRHSELLCFVSSKNLTVYFFI